MIANYYSLSLYIYNMYYNLKLKLQQRGTYCCKLKFVLKNNEMEVFGHTP